jgi:hypothetical protein
MKSRLALAALLAGLALPTGAPAYPPITCGRMTVAGGTYVVRTHGPTCAFAERWLRTFLTRHRGPDGYRCRAYGTDVPAYCKSTRHRYRFRYFFANAAS